jgi:hypothetical protein
MHDCLVTVFRAGQYAVGAGRSVGRVQCRCYLQVLRTARGVGKDVHQTPNQAVCPFFLDGQKPKRESPSMPLAGSLSTAELTLVVGVWTDAKAAGGEMSARIMTWPRCDVPRLLINGKAWTPLCSLPRPGIGFKNGRHLSHLQRPQIITQCVMPVLVLSILRCWLSPGIVPRRPVS